MSDIERDHQFDSEDERVVDEGDLEGTGPGAQVHSDPEAPEADVVDQQSEVPLDDDD